MPALEQSDAQLRLERLDLMADRALGDRQLVGRPGEARMARGRLEGAYGIEGRQAARHPILDENS